MKGNIVVVDEDGYGKRISTDEIRRTSRGVKGVKVTNRADVGVIPTLVVKESDDVLIFSDGGNVAKIPLDDIPLQGRNTRGVKLIELEEDSKVKEVMTIPKDGE